MIQFHVEGYLNNFIAERMIKSIEYMETSLENEISRFSCVNFYYSLVLIVKVDTLEFLFIEMNISD